MLNHPKDLPHKNKLEIIPIETCLTDSAKSNEIRNILICSFLKNETQYIANKYNSRNMLLILDLLLKQLEHNEITWKVVLDFLFSRGFNLQNGSLYLNNTPFFLYILL